MPSNANLKSEDPPGHSSKKQKLTPNSLIGIVEVIVGPQKKSFKIHKQRLSDLCPSLEQMLARKPKKGDEHLLELLGEKIPTFEQFQCWLYTGSIPVTEDIVKDKDCTPFTVLTDLYVFGDRFEIPALQNRVIDGIVKARAVKDWTPFLVIPRICYQLPTTSPLRKLFVDFFVNDADPSIPGWLSADNLEFFPQDFLFDVAKTYAGRIMQGRQQIHDFTAIRSTYYI